MPTPHQLIVNRVEELNDQEDAARDALRLSFRQKLQVVQQDCAALGHIFERGWWPGRHDEKPRYCLFCRAKEPEAGA